MKGRISDLNRLQHIRDAISDLQSILKDIDEDQFYRNIEKKYATERLLEIIGEAIKHLSPETIESSKNQMDISRFTEFRNMVSHEYFRVDYTIIYEIAVNKIPILDKVITDLINQLDVTNA